MHRLVLVTGATGYVGGRLVPPIVSCGYGVRCLVRKPEQARNQLAPSVEIVAGDLLDRDSAMSAMRGVDTAFYLVHALRAGGDIWRDEITAADNFARAAKQAGVRRIIFLGGLGDALGHPEHLSPHLATRQAVGRILRESGVQTLEFRASIIIGSGSMSFEMIRTLVDRLPVMVTPLWVNRLAQPIGIEDVISYLVAAIEVLIHESAVLEIGGSDRGSYRDLMREYARQRGLHRLMIPVPFLSPRLSGLWLSIVTPLRARVGRRLLEGVRTDTVVNDDHARVLFPEIHPRDYREAIRRALSNEDREAAGPSIMPRAAA
jgi:Predicted nucleoside-diphosphate-sugar epimerases